jgi:hypothetical protein
VKWRRGNEIGAEFITATRFPASPGIPSAVKQQRAESQRSKSRTSTLSSCTQRQQQGVSQLKAETREVVVSTSYEEAKTGSISGDKAKVGVSGGEKHLPTGTPEIARGVTGLVVPDRRALRRQNQIADVSEQLDKTNQEKDNKKRLDLSRLEKELGPNHVALIQALKDVEPDSPHGRELASIIDGLTRSRTERS